MTNGRLVACLVWTLAAVACGNQEQPPATTPTATASAAPSSAPLANPVASESAAPVASAAPSAAPTAPPVPQITKPLKELVANAKTIKLVWREKLDSNEAKTATINAPATIKAIVDAFGPDQMPGAEVPSYMWTYTFRFEDKGGNPLATVSLFASPSMSEEKKRFGRVDVATGGFGGLTIAKYEDLQKKLKALGVPLP